MTSTDATGARGRLAGARGWARLVLLAVAVAGLACGLAHPNGEHKAPARGVVARRASQERLLVLRKTGLHELTCDAASGTWKGRFLVGLPSLPGEPWYFSGPVRWQGGRWLIFRSDPETQTAQAYVWKPGLPALSRIAAFRVEGKAGYGSEIDCSVPSEKLIVLTYHAGEAFADWLPVRLLGKGRVSMGDEADASISRLRRKAPKVSEGWDGLHALAWSGDGSLVAAGLSRRIAIYQRRSGRLRLIRVPVDYFCSLSFSRDNKVVAWTGTLHDRPPEVPHEELPMPMPDAFGITWLDTGRSPIWQASKVKGWGSTSKMDGDQGYARIRINDRKDALYFYALLGRASAPSSLMRFDIHAQTVEEVPGVGEFAILPSK